MEGAKENDIAPRGYLPLTSYHHHDPMLSTLVCANTPMPLTLYKSAQDPIWEALDLTSFPIFTPQALHPAHYIYRDAFHHVQQAADCMR